MLVSLAGDITKELKTLNKFEGNQSEYTENFMKYIRLHSEAKEFCGIDFYLFLLNSSTL